MRDMNVTTFMTEMSAYGWVMEEQGGLRSFKTTLNVIPDANVCNLGCEIGRLVAIVDTELFKRREVRQAVNIPFGLNLAP
eukprot:1175740-Karenia_brevis.AAC.1